MYKLFISFILYTTMQSNQIFAAQSFQVSKDPCFKVGISTLFVGFVLATSGIIVYGKERPSDNLSQAWFFGSIACSLSSLLCFLSVMIKNCRNRNRIVAIEGNREIV